jgi:hypothetical protein
MGKSKWLEDAETTAREKATRGRLTVLARCSSRPRAALVPRTRGPIQCLAPGHTWHTSARRAEASHSCHTRTAILHPVLRFASTGLCEISSPHLRLFIGFVVSTRSPQTHTTSTARLRLLSTPSFLQSASSRTTWRCRSGASQPFIGQRWFLPSPWPWRAS